MSTSIFCWAATGTGCGFSTPGTLTRALVREPAGKTRGYVNELIARARQRGLAKTAQWRRLGHYVPSPPNGFESEAAGQNFFLAPNGKNDPQAELDATLRGFFSELAPYDAKDPKHKNVRHPLCQFPARFLWLSKALSIDSKRLKLRACAPYSEFKSSLQAKSVTLVFSSYYLNNPASAFGHTFLRINKANPHVPEERRQLLDYGLDFSAEVDTKNALFYAIKGIFGLFPGTFRKLPYYYKVREYNDYESRDLWEYELTLGEAQLNMLVAHAWELGATFFPYYYATANCSYAILALLEAADPSLSLLAHLHAPVIPADTVKSLYGNKGLVGRVKYRPSMRSVFQHRTRNLTDEQLTSLEHLVQTPDAPLPAALTTAQRIQMFDAAQDLVDIRYSRELVDIKKDGQGAKIKQRLMERRAEMLVPSADADVPVPSAKRPERGHASRRLAMGGGVDSGGGRFLTLGGRLALHDLADSAPGYPELAQLEFLQTKARFDVVSRAFQLDELDLVRVVSLTSYGRFDPHMSWNVRFGALRMEDAGCHCVGGRFAIGGGAAKSWMNDGLTLFTTLQTQVISAPDLHGIAGIPLRVGVGPSIGARWRISDRLVALATAELLWQPQQDPVTALTIAGTLRWQAAQALAFDLAVTHERGSTACVLQTMIYF